MPADRVQRDLFASRPCGLQPDAFRRCREAMRDKALSARFTDFESRKTRATSGASTTTLVPALKRFAYFPRMPREKSYSLSIPGSRTARLFFFILCGR